MVSGLIACGGRSELTRRFEAWLSSDSRGRKELRRIKDELNALLNKLATRSDPLDIEFLAQCREFLECDLTPGLKIPLVDEQIL